MSAVSNVQPKAFNWLKPVYHRSWLQGTLLRRTRSFFPNGGRNHRQYSLHLPTEGRPGWVGMENTGMVYPPKVVTNPSTSWARRSLTLLMCPTPLPLRRTSHYWAKDNDLTAQ